MKHYNNRELDEKINAFLTKKFEKYPELTAERRTTLTVPKPNFTVRMLQWPTA